MHISSQAGLFSSPAAAISSKFTLPEEGRFRQRVKMAGGSVLMAAANPIYS
jgi:hypothetical protein